MASKLLLVALLLSPILALPVEVLTLSERSVDNVRNLGADADRL